MAVSSRRERERLERRAAILDAADRVFLDKGFDQATMDEIAAEAEFSKGTLYLYFKNKDDLFVALSTRKFEDMVDAFESLAAGEPTGVAALRAILARYASFITANEQHFRVAMGRLISGDMFGDDLPSFADHQAQITRIVDSFITALERGKRDGTIRPELDSQATSGHLWGAIMGTMIIRINSDELARRFPRPISFDHHVEGFIRLVCGGLQPADEVSRS